MTAPPAAELGTALREGDEFGFGRALARSTVWLAADPESGQDPLVGLDEADRRYLFAFTDQQELHRWNPTARGLLCLGSDLHRVIEGTGADLIAFDAAGTSSVDIGLRWLAEHLGQDELVAPLAELATFEGNAGLRDRLSRDGGEFEALATTVRIGESRRAAVVLGGEQHAAAATERIQRSLAAEVAVELIVVEAAQFQELAVKLSEFRVLL